MRQCLNSKLLEIVQGLYQSLIIKMQGSCFRVLSIAHGSCMVELRRLGNHRPEAPNEA